MTELEAIAQRHSIRKYKPLPLAAEAAAALRKEIDSINAASGLHFQLVTDEPKAFSTGIFSYGQFRGVSNYIMVIGKKGREQDAGYWGERLVLLAQRLGLNTCWVGLTYKKIPGAYRLAEGEKVMCTIAVGYGDEEGRKHKIKAVEQVSNAGPDTPDWFLAAVQRALLAPTAVNQQKFYFEYLGADRVRATARFSLVGYTNIDLGIAKYHFAAGAPPFTWVS